MVMPGIETEQKLEQLAQRLHMENNLIHFLFLIGIQESGEGFRKFTKDEKTDLIELGSARLLVLHDYYIKIDTQGATPFFVVNPDKPLPEHFEREALLKNEIINYFDENLDNHE